MVWAFDGGESGWGWGEGRRKGRRRERALRRSFVSTGACCEDTSIEDTNRSQNGVFSVHGCVQSSTRDQDE